MLVTCLIAVGFKARPSVAPACDDLASAVVSGRNAVQSSNIAQFDDAVEKATALGD